MTKYETHMHRDYYEDVAGQFEKGSIRIRNQVRNVTELLRIENGELVLEIGVGSGKYTSLISRTNAVVGVDVSDESLAVARKTVTKNGTPENVSLVISRGEWLPFKAARFDQALCIDFIEHLTDEGLSAVLTGVHRVLKSGGKLTVYTPNRKHIFEYIRKPPAGHVGLRTPGEIHEFLIRHGFRIDVFYVRPSHFPVFDLIERLLMHLPVIGIFFRKRICIIASALPG